MIAAGTSPEQLIAPDDDFDLPIVVRRATPLKPERRPGPRRLNLTVQPWPGGLPAASGDFVCAMTWRDLLDAAMTVGRDVAPWLLRFPGLAWQEVVARESPLKAFLVRERSPLLNSPTGWALRPSVVYTAGTERTAQAAFSYRLGMTIAEWAARGLCGLGATTHCENGVPSGAPTGWTALRGQPDLYCRDSSAGTWLIEAKGGRRLGLPELRKGAQQVETAARGFNPLSVNMVVGASIEHVLYATVDVDELLPPAATGAAARAARDDEALVAAVRSRMLAYAVLLGTPAERRTVRIAAGVPEFGPRTVASPLVKLEKDEQTSVAREELARAPQDWRQAFGQVTDYLVADVPGTGVALGLPREMFVACAAYADLAREMDDIAEDRMPSAAPDGYLEEVQLEDRRQRKAGLLAEVRQERKDVVTRRLLDSFEEAKGTSWEYLTQRAVTYADSVNAPEAASSAAYLSAREPFR